MPTTRSLAAALAGSLTLAGCPSEPPARPPRPPHSQPASAPSSQPVASPSSQPLVAGLEHLSAEQRAYRALHRARWDGATAAAALRWGHDPFLLEALWRYESKKRARAESPKGARGFSQMMPSAAREVGRWQRTRGHRPAFTHALAYDPEQAIPAGAELLAYWIGRCSGLAEALVAYNRGSCGRPNAFSSNVLRLMNQLRLEATLPPMREPPPRRPRASSPGPVS